MSQKKTSFEPRGARGNTGKSKELLRAAGSAIHGFSPCAPWLKGFIGFSAALVAGSAGAAESAQPTSAGGIFQVLMGLTLVLGLMALLAWALKRLNAGRPTGNAAIRIVGGVSVGTRERILVVEAAEQWIVVGVAPGSVNALTTMPRQETPPAPAAMADANFPAWLRQALGKK